MKRDGERREGREEEEGTYVCGFMPSMIGSYLGCANFPAVHAFLLEAEVS